MVTAALLQQDSEARRQCAQLSIPVREGGEHLQGMTKPLPIVFSLRG